MREERRVVTALSADLVGSTAIAAGLDPEDARLVVGEAVARMVHAVEEFGGTVKDLAGDGVMALFGAPTAHEDDGERALRAALRIVESVRAFSLEVNRSFGIDSLDVRIGVNTGAVLVGPVGGGGRVEYGATGDAVNVAARLQSAAPAGSVFVGAATKRLAEQFFRWGPKRDLALKGKSSVVPAFLLEGLVAPAHEETLAPLLGRDVELRAAREAISEVVDGSGSILFLSGEAGIGKSRLLAELRGEARIATWLEGKCVSFGESMPYWPFRDLLRDWLGLALDDPELRTRVTLRRALERLAGVDGGDLYPYLALLLGLAAEPDWHGRVTELSPEALQYRTFEVVGELLARLAAEGPTVVTIEDLHWADATSLQLLEQLLSLVDDEALLLVVTLRPDPDHPSWGVRDLAGRRFPHRVREIELTPLSGDAERELLHVLLGGRTIAPEAAAQLLAHAEGNPLFLEELARWHLEHDGGSEIPPTIEKVVLARIDRLSELHRSVLTAASVLGRSFALPLLSGVVEADGELNHVLHELQRLDLVRQTRRWPQPEFRFKHAVIQEAVYRTIIGAERRRLHAEAARWLEERSDSVEDVLALLAHHWLAASDEEKAIEYLTRAGDKARLEHALDEAIEHYRQLLPLLERRGESQEVALVLFKLALALHTSLRFAESNAAYQEAFDYWERPAATTPATATLRIATTFVPDDPDPLSAISWSNIQLGMQLFDRLVEAWPEATILPSLAARWDIADDGLRYVFHLRDGLQWSDGKKLTADDVEFGIKRVLDPNRAGESVAIYFVLENAQDYYLGRNPDADSVGVRALDERTVEFRLAAPAPYFLSVMNRPDAGPQPRHAIERDSEDWTATGKQIVSGPFQIEERSAHALVLRRRDEGANVTHGGNVGRVELVRSSVKGALAPYDEGKFDLVAIRYSALLMDELVLSRSDAVLGPAGMTAYLGFNHSDPVGGDTDFRRALAHAINRDALADVLPENLMVATGGLVPPALPGHTPDIAPRFDPELARTLLAQSHSADAVVRIAATDEWINVVEVISAGWQETLGIQIETPAWSPEELARQRRPWTTQKAHLVIAGWLPGYSDPEYYLRLLLHSDSKTNEGGFSYPPFDELIERARQERNDRARLEFFHEADRLAVAERAALIPIAYGRSMALVKPHVNGWWEYGKMSASFAEIHVDIPTEAPRSEIPGARPSGNRHQREATWRS